MAFTFQPYQIVCLEHNTSRLYAEVVQLAELRQICWIRPLVLVEAAIAADDAPGDWLEQAHRYDLRQGSDLLLPAVLLRLAIDSEVIPLLGWLYAPISEQTDQKLDGTGQQQLRQFLQRICSAYPAAFQAKGSETRMDQKQ